MDFGLYTAKTVVNIFHSALGAKPPDTLWLRLCKQQKRKWKGMEVES